MLKMRTIVLSVWGAFAIAGCASLNQLSNKPSQPVPANDARQVARSPDDLYRLGRYYQGEIHYDRAIEAYQQALSIDHRLADAHNGLGVVYAEQGRYDEAIREFKAAIELSPGVAYLHNNLGYALLLLGSNHEALGALEIAQRLEPSNEKVLFNLRLAHERLSGLQSNKARATAGVPVTVIPKAQSDSSTVKVVVVAPSVYELRVPERTQPQVASVKEGVIEEEPVQPHQSAKKTLRPFKLEVSNGNGSKGLAKRVARLLEERGVRTGRITNHTTFLQARTEIQYRKGFLTEASSLREFLPTDTRTIPSSSLRNDIQVRVLLGRDARSETALPELGAHPIVTAHATLAHKR
jgi:tetratricopeptide (TPR) repeat protein